MYEENNGQTFIDHKLSGQVQNRNGGYYKESNIKLKENEINGIIISDGLYVTGVKSMRIGQ